MRFSKGATLIVYKIWQKFCLNAKICFIIICNTATNIVQVSQNKVFQSGPQLLTVKRGGFIGGVASVPLSFSRFKVEGWTLAAVDLSSRPHTRSARTCPEEALSAQTSAAHRSAARRSALVYPPRFCVGRSARRRRAHLPLSSSGNRTDFLAPAAPTDPALLLQDWSTPRVWDKSQFEVFFPFPVGFSFRRP